MIAFALHEASAKRNVSVEFIINDDEINRKSSELLDRLEQNGIRIRFFDPTMGLMYHKFCIIDDKMLITGSYNWTFHLSCRLKSFHAVDKKLFRQRWGSIAKANEIFPG